MNTKRTDITTPAADGTTGEVAAFLQKARAIGAMRATRKGRLILALDATMSRQPTWDLACELQAGMFDAAGNVGGLEMQLVYFRGHGECRASQFVGNAARLKELMVRIDCRGGHTQIGKVLSHALRDTGRAPVNALVYIGDAMEEKVDDLCDLAGQLGLRKLPVFLFQEGHDPVAERAFREIARLSGGAWLRFDQSSAAQLSRLLASIAVFASGGLPALEARGTAEDRLLIGHLKGGK